MYLRICSHSWVSMLRVKRHRLASWVPWSRILRLGFQNNPWQERPVDCVWSCWHCCLCGLSLRLLRLKGTQQCDKVLIVVSLEDDLHFSFVAPPVKTLVAPGGVVWVHWVSAVMTAPCPELASLGLLPLFAWRSLRAPVNGFVPLLSLSYPACTVLQTPVCGRTSGPLLFGFGMFLDTSPRLLAWCQVSFCGHEWAFAQCFQAFSGFNSWINILPLHAVAHFHEAFGRCHFHGSCPAQFCL